MKIPFLDLKSQYLSIQSEMDKAIKNVILDAAFIGGKYLRKFEEDFANYCNARYCVGVGNGTEALFIAMKALEIGTGDEVITSANSFIATSEAITATGAKVVFVDCHSHYYTIDINKIEEKINNNTKAIIPVHIYGQPADMDKINEIAKKNNLFIIEDAAQAHGAKYKNRKVGTLGDIACFSFYPGKNLGAYGDGGAIVTHNEELAKKCRMLSNHGRIEKYNHEFEGYNSRLDGLQSAILSVKLKYINKWNAKRRSIVKKYNDMLKNMNVIIPKELTGTECAYHQYVIRVKNRDDLRKYLKSNGISTGIHYPISLPFLQAYKYLGHKQEDFPVTYQYQKKILSLPIYAEMKDEIVKYVADKIKEFYAKMEKEN